MSPTDAARFDDVLYTQSVEVVFQRLLTFYATARTLHEQSGSTERASACEIARDGAQAVVSLLSERVEANERESEALIALLRASLSARCHFLEVRHA